MKRDLFPQQMALVFDRYLRQMQSSNLIADPEAVAKAILYWTKGQPLLTKKLFQYILDSPRTIPQGEEVPIVEQLIINRLIKEFKQDELTLHIRKLLYAKDLVRLLIRTGEKIGSKEATFLVKKQQKLGLSRQQAERIKASYLSSQLSVRLKTTRTGKNSVVRVEPLAEDFDPELDLISLLENSPIYQELLTTENSTPEKVTPPPKRHLRNQKLWWIGASIPLLLLGFKLTNWQYHSGMVTATDETGQTELDRNCLAVPQSSYMSLGTRLLTSPKLLSTAPDLDNWQRATTAFAQCEYETAQTELQQVADRNHHISEISIYLNNARAIASKTESPGINQVKIAVTVSFDRQPEIAEEILRGVAKAQTDINLQGGINSHPLLIQVVNLPPELKLATQIAKNLTADPDILAVIAHDSADKSLKLAQIYQREGLVMMAPTSTNADLTQVGDRIFPMAPDLTSLANTLASYAVVSSLSKIDVCADLSDPDSSFFAREFTSKLPSFGNDIPTFDCDFASPNFNPTNFVAAAIANNVEAILLAPSSHNIDRAIAIAQTNQQRLTLLGSHTLHSEKTLQVGKTAVAKMVLPTPWLSGNSTEQFGSDRVSWRTAMSYDATRAIVHGLDRGNNRQALYTSLNHPCFEFNGTTGKINFVDGDRAKVKLTYIDKSEQNTAQYQFMPLKIN
ncbi:MAG: ABC transporter substrate-binding protein [Cyanobacteria bacterium J06623_7]